MNVFGIGLPELAVILVLALLVFGPKKLPEIGRNLARALGSFQKASQEFEAELKRGAAELEQGTKVDPLPQADAGTSRPANPEQTNPPALYDPATAAETAKTATVQATATPVTDAPEPASAPASDTLDASDPSATSVSETSEAPPIAATTDAVPNDSDTSASAPSESGTPADPPVS
ncbi:MAG: TatA/E family twin arginine-targeting protein translocase [Prochlorothrix sp.]|nr:TatA/E family twin arginine-targeting protein translocase [Prochlorothrix sp.]